MITKIMGLFTFLFRGSFFPEEGFMIGGAGGEYRTAPGFLAPFCPRDATINGTDSIATATARRLVGVCWCYREGPVTETLGIY